SRGSSPRKASDSAFVVIYQDWAGHLPSPSSEGDCWMVLHDTGEPNALSGRGQNHRDVVENQRPFDSHIEIAAFLPELTGVEPAPGWQANVDAGMVRQVMRCFGAIVLRKI